MKKTNVILLLAVIILAAYSSCTNENSSPFRDGDIIEIEKSELLDKVKGGWVGQLIGCTYGGPTEFKWQGAMIHDMVPIPWDEYQHEFWYDNFPGLYDDIYTDLTFVEVFEKYGLDATAEQHGVAFANKG
ncbi:MAG TPA: ADP-ribosylglycohydrolase family protein, partial [Bacteroidales bacterium]|nr:ADP-ribosylglycohydrolase family protein [Bacteroidales bacterium]